MKKWSLVDRWRASLKYRGGSPLGGWIWHGRRNMDPVIPKWSYNFVRWVANRCFLFHCGCR